MGTTLITALLSNAGIGGIILLLLLTGQLVTGSEHKRLADDFEKQSRALEIERQRNADLLIWASTGARALQAVAQVAEERNPSSVKTPPGGP